MTVTIINTHYCPVYKPHPTKPQIIGWNVWAWIGHPLLGELKGTLTFCKTVSERRKTIKALQKLSA